MMKRFTLILIMVVSFSITASAKKDINAWKKESSLEQQYEVFKKNLNYWSGSYFMKPEQLDDFYGALKDSVSVLENTNRGSENQIKSLQTQLSDNREQTKNIQVELDESIKSQNSISVLGMQVNKNVYSFTMYAFILGVLVIAGVVFMLFKRSNTVTVRTKKEYQELKEEFDAHKKNALDRYTKMNMELHKTRLELNRK